MDDHLFPKIADFGLSKKIQLNKDDTDSIQSSSEMKGTNLYLSPEIIKDNNYTKAGDVYAFEIITALTPFEEVEYFKLLKEIVNGRHPIFKYPIDDAYRHLIERCWAQNPNDRPTFEQIVNELKTNREFITDSIDEYEFYDYVDFIDDYKCTYDNTKRIINYECFKNDLKYKFKKIKFDLTGFNLIENFGEICIAQKGTEKIVIKKFIPINDEANDSYVEDIMNLEKCKSVFSTRIVPK